MFAKEFQEIEEVSRKQKKSIYNAMREGKITKEQYNKYISDGYSKNTPIDI